MCSFDPNIVMATGSAVGALVSAVVIWYDVHRRNLVRSVWWVQVPTANPGGVEEYKTVNVGAGTLVNKISIFADNTVEITWVNDTRTIHEKFLKCKQGVAEA